MTAKKLGIWMDHEHAQLTEFTIDPMKTTHIACAFTTAIKEESVSKGEHGMHSKLQHQRAEYYKKIGEQIRHYQEVLVFGPTRAKDELINLLRDDHLFTPIKIRVETTDKMTESQSQAFVKKHFSRH